MARRVRLGWLVALCGPLFAGIAGAAPDLDPTFGTGGVVTTAVSSTSATPHDVVVQSDGKIIAAGEAENASFIRSSVLLRYLPNGSPDAGFGTAGRVTGPLPVIEAVALQPDGKIVAAGSLDSSTIDVAVARYQTDGTLDTTFGVGGVFTAMGADFELLTDIVLQPDGKIVAVGGSAAGGTWDTRLYRLLDDGTLDASFGTGGIAVHDLSVPDHDLPIDVALQPDGKIVTAGYVSGYADIVAGVVRFDDTGNLDASFGTGGIAVGPTGYFSQVLVQDDGRIVSIGRAGLVRYDASGVLDSTFGTAGIVAFPGGGGEFRGLVRTADDKYQTAGVAFHDSANYTDDALVLARYTADGVRDTTYGMSGVLEISLAPDVGSAVAVASALQADGKMIVLAFTSALFQPYASFTLLRLSSPVCGDGLVEAGEPCDDGNLVAGDGCDPSCLIEPCHRCTGAPSTCDEGPRTCTTSMRPDRSKLVVVNDLAFDDQDKFKWSWKEGGAIALADLGDPRDLDGQYLCLFDATEQAVARFDLPPGGTCGTKPCWQLTSKRIAYNDPTVASDGVRKMTLRVGAAGVPKIAFKAQGLGMPDPAMPVSLPLTVELQRPTGQCWSATYTSETVPVNTTERLRGVAAP